MAFGVIFTEIASIGGNLIYIPQVNPGLMLEFDNENGGILKKNDVGPATAFAW